MSMKRVNFYLTEQQIAKLKELFKSTGLSISEHIRRAIDEYVKKIEKVSPGENLE